MLRSYAARKFLSARRIFRTGRDAKAGVENVFLTLEQNGIIGYGEASPNRYFQESAEAVHLALLGCADFLKWKSITSIDDIEALWNAAQANATLSLATLCAIDLACWDLLGKIKDQTLSEMCWGIHADPTPTSVTLSVSTPDELEARIAEVLQYPIVKVKLDSKADLSLLIRLREAGIKRLWVDANASWTAVQCSALLPKLIDLGVEALEQPLPPACDAEMETLVKQSPIPLLADESCVQVSDLKRLSRCFSGINIKLVKCGGLTPALKMHAEARKCGLKIMVGCMLESSVLISAGLALAQKVDFADLDGSWLLAEDPFLGPEFKGGTLIPRLDPGLGVFLKDDASRIIKS